EQRRRITRAATRRDRGCRERPGRSPPRSLRPDTEPCTHLQETPICLVGDHLAGDQHVDTEELAMDRLEQAVSGLDTAFNGDVIRDVVDVGPSSEGKDDAPSARFRGTLGLDSLAKPLLGFFDEYLNRFFSDGNAFATCEGGIGLIDHRDEFEPPPLTLFPKRKCLLNGFFLALEAAVLDGFANERLLIRS